MTADGETDPLPPVPSPEVDAVAVPWRNEVALVGRLGGGVTDRVLPSGDVVCSFRLVVPRGSETSAPARSRPSVDVIDCSVWGDDARRDVSQMQPGSVLDVRGRIHRRFWRAASGGAASRWDVEVRAVRLVSDARTNTVSA